MISLMILINIITQTSYHTVGNFVGLIFCGLGSSDNFVSLYIHGVSPLIT